MITQKFEDKIIEWAMKCPIPKGTVPLVDGSLGVSEEDTTAHGCPIIIYPNGEKRPTTLYLHDGIAEVVIHHLRRNMINV